MTVGLPSADEAGAYIWLDHDAEETWLVEEVAARLRRGDELCVAEQDGGLLIRWRGADHVSPLTYSPHDRYITLSSLAELLKPAYRFLLLKETLSESQHGVLVRPAEEAPAELPPHLIPLQQGLDYFEPGPLTIPYLDHPAPGFVAQSRALAGERVAAGEEMLGLLKRDPEVQRALKALRREAGRPWWKFW
ncbi:MAG TPA: hypothetical protein VEA80_07670 [Vitreimonas sp.]|uniref:hypothetical protein n=1 Tax=Vitreimonas sp. TaxID=3069702 RepID=UPI002D589EA1|nr:hypothetical protein [Vitreimonas sp.]HYD87337.1 hypothetical protein [Vitreimonas sp.]